MNEQNNKNNMTIIIILGLIIVLLVIGITVGVANLTSNKKQNAIPNNQDSTVTINNNKEQNSLPNNQGSTATMNNNNEKEKSANTNSNDLKNSFNSKNNNTYDENNTVNVDTTNTTASNATTNNTTTTENFVNNNDGEINAINVAIVNGVKITVPATKESFDKVGWEWDPKYAETDLANGYTASGGRVGNYPGGAVLSVLNISGETKKFKDCVIDDVTFYNPKDGSENVTFIGGLNYNSTEDDVKNTFAKLGYKNVKELNLDDSYGTYRTYKYFLNDDSSNFMDYIEFIFMKGIMDNVSINTSGR